ncbi:L-alanine-DL-glutamate epimerase-like enolase superfamily enzyme [Halarchaeum rubridurum]|uniref:Dipeptide epimerase n=1 Tax=Halarchaeum rubridurum TaxID=489911 RepID=A0A830FXT5_9EURY|nr:dipeptide epimerase [Halarchaeum rubridurum]MBP1953971.1 L-alanine-DL-glutamate epimerase-like enolase superfamily enzyme [Halarchaeum rubridurum]GGM56286.1 dipeptide epimerase [Halarchaeum rubridurum]
MSLATEFERLSLPLEHEFGISRGSSATAENVVVRVTDGDHTGVGAAAPAAHYGETPATVEAVLPDLLAAVERVGDPANHQRLAAAMADVVRDNPAARAAVDIACCDLAAKRADMRLYRYWGLDPASAPETSFTIGLDDTERMRAKTRDAVAVGYGTLKVKLGTSRDREIVAAVREAAPDATLRVDANEAWTPREAVANTAWLADHGVEFVEQPVPAENPDGMRFVREHGALPVAADESCVTLADVSEVAEIADIANVKLMKCGGPSEARRLIHAARAGGLDVMLGCMVSTNAAIAAAAHLAPLVDYADLDGSLLLADDPYEGVPMPEGRIALDAVERPGTGARLAE